MFYNGKEFKNIGEVNSYRKGYEDGSRDQSWGEWKDKLDSASSIKKTMKCPSDEPIKINWCIVALVVLGLGAIGAAIFYHGYENLLTDICL